MAINKILFDQTQKMTFYEVCKIDKMCSFDRIAENLMALVAKLLRSFYRLLFIKTFQDCLENRAEERMGQ